MVKGHYLLFSFDWDGTWEKLADLFWGSSSFWISDVIFIVPELFFFLIFSWHIPTFKNIWTLS